MAIPAPGIALPRQRPPRPAVKPRRPSKTARRARQASPGIALRAVDAFEGLSSSAVLDRLIRGRAWIGLLAFALIGIVAMQLLVLELNTGIGHTLTRVAQLQRDNAQLGIEDSASSAESRIAPLAVATGMTLAPVGTVHFVAASPAYVVRAATALSTPLQASTSGGSTEAQSGESGSTGTEGGEAVASSTTPTASTTAAAETEAAAESSSSPTSVQGTAATAGTKSSTEVSPATSGPQE